MINYNKKDIRSQLTPENIFELLEILGGEPQYTDFGIVASTICHNPPGVGSRKLYYYNNADLFHCYSGCEEPSFDIFQLIIKAIEIQKNIKYDLNDAVRYVAQKFNLIEYIEDDAEEVISPDWGIFMNYDRILNLETQELSNIILKDYDEDILNKLNYDIKITPWLNEGINQETIEKAQIGYYLGGDQITIPHFDINNRFIGLRGRAVCQEDIDKYGKYRPLKVMGQMYNHPLSMNLYGLNWCKDNIPIIEKAIVFESEKSVLKAISYFGFENSIYVSCCGSSLSAYQIKLLKDCGAKEIIIAFDREGSKEDKNNYVKRFYRLNDRFKNSAQLSFVYDKTGEYLDFKDSPIDKGKDTFLKLFKERIYI